MNNSVRHAKASAIRIRLEQADGCLRLEVRDDGIGTPVRAVRGNGVGVYLMEHRCGLLGGTFAVVPLTDGGTCVACSVPRV